MNLSPTNVRDHILNESARLFAQRGYDGIAMREIAAACQISKAGIYYHFQDKEELFLALLNANLEKLADLWRRTADGPPGCRARLTRFTLGLFEQFSVEDRAVIRLANQEMHKLSAGLRERFAQQYESTFLGPLAAAFQGGIAAGEIRPRDPHLLVWILLGMLYPFFSPAHPAATATVEEALNVFFEGAVR